MKRKFSLLLVFILLLTSLLGTTAVFADDEERPYIDFYISLGDCEINAVSTNFSADYAVMYYYSEDTYPAFLDEDPFEFEMYNEDGSVLAPNANGTWTLTKGKYTIKWVNMDEIKEQLKGWDYYDQYDFYFPDEDELTRTIYVDGEKSKVSFYIFPSTTQYVDAEGDYVFDPSTLWCIQLDGVPYEDYSILPEIFLGDQRYTFEVKDSSGHVLTDAELAQPMKLGTYTLTWNNVDEIKRLVEESNDAFYEKYEFVFPEEPLTHKFTLELRGEDDEETDWPTEYMGIFSSFGMGDATSWPEIIDWFYFSDIDYNDRAEAYPSYLSNVVCEYYDADGNKLTEEQLAAAPVPGTYTVKWVNYFDFLQQDLDEGWGLQEKYFMATLVEGDCPESTLIIDEPAEEPDGGYEGSVFGNGTLTMVFGFTTVLCLGVIAALLVKISKQKKEIK